MIKCNMNEETCVSGPIEVVAAETEELLRGVRIAFCDNVGEETGNMLFRECIRRSRLSEVERDKEDEELFGEDE